MTPAQVTVTREQMISSLNDLLAMLTPERLGLLNLNSARDCLENAIELLRSQAAPSDARGEVCAQPSVTLSDHQIRNAYEFCGGTFEGTPYVIEWLGKHEREEDGVKRICEGNYFIYSAEYPDEGSMELDDEPDAEPPSPAAADKVAGVESFFLGKHEECAVEVSVDGTHKWTIIPGHPSPIAPGEADPWKAGDVFPTLRLASPAAGEVLTLPQGVKPVARQRLNEILSGYEEFPAADIFEISSLAYEVRNWRMKHPHASPGDAT